MASSAISDGTPATRPLLAVGGYRLQRLVFGCVGAMNPPIKPQIPWDIPALRRYLSLIEVHDLVGLYHKDPALFDLLLTESGESAVDALGLGLSDDPHEKAQALPVGLRRAGIAV